MLYHLLPTRCRVKHRGGPDAPTGFLNTRRPNWPSYQSSCLPVLGRPRARARWDRLGELMKGAEGRRRPRSGLAATGRNQPPESARNAPRVHQSSCLPGLRWRRARQFWDRLRVLSKGIERLGRPAWGSAAHVLLCHLCSPRTASTPSSRWRATACAREGILARARSLEDVPRALPRVEDGPMRAQGAPCRATLHP